MLDILVSLVLRHIGATRALAAVLSVLVVYGFHRWATGFKHKYERRLNGKTWLVVGGLSGVGLVVTEALARLGAQIILVHEDPASATVQQLVYLLRATHSNELIYAEKCDVSDRASIREFAHKWFMQAKKGPFADVDIRLDGILIFHDEALHTGEQAGLFLPRRTTASGAELHHAAGPQLLHAWIDSLLATLDKSSQKGAPTRVISVVSPTYSTAIAKLAKDAVKFDTVDDKPVAEAADLDFVSDYPASSPWIAQGFAAFSTIALLRQWQIRLTAARAFCVCACPGWTRSYLFALLRASPSHPAFSLLGLLVYIALLPFSLLFLKSDAQAAESVLDVIFSHFSTIIASDTAPAQTPLGDTPDASAEKGPKILKGGALYRDGLEIRPSPVLHKHLVPLGQAIWRYEDNVANETSKEKST